MIHAPEGAFETVVGRVYIFFGHLGVLVHHDVCGKAVVYLSMSLNPSAVSLRISCASAQGEHMFVRIEVLSLCMPCISAIGL